MLKDPAPWGPLLFVCDCAAFPASAVSLDGFDVGPARLRGTGRIEAHGPITDAAWAASTNFARRCYLGDGPGAVSDGPTSGLPPEFEGTEPDDTQIIPARENFAVLLIDIAEVDWLYLAHTGHQRAQFSRAGEVWTGRWVAP